jgi:hypothetical protein
VNGLYPDEVVITDQNLHEFINPLVAGERKAHGLRPRNYNTHPVGCYAWAPPFDFPLIPKNEYSARIDDMEGNKSRTSDVRMKGGPGGGMVPSRDQDGKGFCWAHSGVSCHLLIHTLMGQPYADLSAFAIACIIKSYQDEGGWGAQGVDWQVDNGCPTSATWPQQSMSRSNDNAAMRAEAAKYKIVSQWADLSAAQYDRKMTFDQMATLLLLRCPVVTDFNWWSHSVCAVDLCKQGATEMRTDTGKMLLFYDRPRFDAIYEVVGFGDNLFCIRLWNSWGDSWSANGMGTLDPSKSVPDGAVAPRLVLAA